METPFKMRSGGSTPFKELGSSPVKGVGALIKAGVKVAKRGYKAIKKVYKKHTGEIGPHSLEGVTHPRLRNMIKSMNKQQNKLQN